MRIIFKEKIRKLNKKIFNLIFYLKFNIRNYLSQSISFFFNLYFSIQINNTKKRNYKIFIYSSQYQKRICDLIIYKKYIEHQKYVINNRNIGFIFIYQNIDLNVLKRIKNINNLAESILKNKLEIPDTIYISHISFWHFPNPITYAFFISISRISKVFYIDDGISGTIPNNMVNQLKFCPNPKEVYSLLYLNKENHEIKNKIPFELYLNKFIKEQKKSYLNLTNHKSILIIASKALDYKYIKYKLHKKNTNFKKIQYILHPRKRKNNQEFLNMSNSFYEKDLENYIYNNINNLEELYIGISATTLFIMGLIFREKTNCKINLCLYSNSKIKIYDSEIESFLNYCKDKNIFSNITYNGKFFD